MKEMEAKLEAHDNGSTKQVQDDESIGYDGHDCGDHIREVEELEYAKAEVGEVKQENQRLKKMLQRIENDYRTLQTRFFDILQHDQSSSSLVDTSPNNEEAEKEEKDEPEISLSLGFQTPPKPKNNNNNYNYDDDAENRKDEVKLMSEGLSLGLKSSSSKDDGSDQIRSGKSNEVEEVKEEDDIEETWPPNKVLKTKKCNDVKEEETLQQNTTNRRARVSVRARCDTPTMNDGCQWRKYGQKISKGNPCPRAYYRCTVGPSCPVRKQVQRCSEDMSILTTTYEGTHNHPLQVAATAMASTTSAAASILMSGSSTSESLNSSTPTTANLNGLNFTLYSNPRTGQLNLPGAPSTTPPTITLDLTTSPFNTRTISNNFMSSQKYPSRSLDFSSSYSEANPLFPTAWSNTYLNNYSSLSFARPIQRQMSSIPYLERTNQCTSSFSSSSSSQQFLTETLTKILTSDPSFQSAVAAAISSMVGSSNNNSIDSTKWVNAEGLVPSLRSSNDQLQNSFPESLLSNSHAAESYTLVRHNSFPTSLAKSSSHPDLRDQQK